jgi:hypothetical protein
LFAKSVLILAHQHFGTILVPYLSKEQVMTTKNEPAPEQKAPKEWEEPTNPEAATDSRDKEQAERLIEEALRRKENLTDPEDPEKEKKS